MASLVIRRLYKDAFPLLTEYLDAFVDDIETMFNVTLLSGENFALESIPEESLETGTLRAVKFAAGSITTSKIADNAIVTDKIADASITTAKLADSSVTNDKINNEAIITSKIAAASITSTKVAFNRNTYEILGGGAIVSNVTTSFQSFSPFKIEQTITTSGKPVEISFKNTKIQFIRNGSIMDCEIRLRRTTEGVSSTISTIVTISPNTTITSVENLSTLFFLDTPSAGTHLYELQMRYPTTISGQSISIEGFMEVAEV